MLSAAIAISYFDRQTLGVAIKAIQQNIPISDAQYSWLTSAFLVTYALMYAGGGKLLDVLGTRRGFVLIMVVVAGLCEPWPGYQLLHALRQPLAAGHG